MIWVLSICSNSLLQLALMRSKAVCRLLLHDDADIKGTSMDIVLVGFAVLVHLVLQCILYVVY
jgi:hypothetical protein